MGDNDGVRLDIHGIRLHGVDTDAEAVREEQLEQQGLRKRLPTSGVCGSDGVRIFPDLDSIRPDLVHVIVKEVRQKERKESPMKALKPIATKLIFDVKHEHTNCAIYSHLKVSIGPMKWKCTMPGKYTMEQCKSLWNRDKSRFKLY